MKNKINTIRFKLVLTFFESTLLSFLCMIILCLLMIAASASRPFAIFFYKYILLFFLLFIMLFSIFIILFFFMLTKSKVRYLEEITRAIETISNDNLEVTIDVKGTDELGKLAKSINSMSHRLKTLIEAERKNEKVKNELITNLSHDLRTPLTSVIGYIDIISKGMYKNEVYLTHYADTAYVKCMNLKMLIDALFEYSKLNNPDFKIEKKQINLRELLEQIVLGFMPSFKEFSIEYKLSFPDEKIMINADPVLIARMFDNIINNSVKYGKDGKRLDVILHKEENKAIVQIVNYGKPIPEESLHNIFDKFYRADKSRSAANGSSGLGLAIVKSIAEKHNGKVTVESSEEKTIFQIIFTL